MVPSTPIRDPHDVWPRGLTNSTATVPRSMRPVEKVVGDMQSDRISSSIAGYSCGHVCLPISISTLPILLATKLSRLQHPPAIHRA